MNGRRKGATMVLVALLITVLVGMAGFAIDFSRMYVMKAQLQTTADASALAAIIEVRDKRPTNATTVALQYPPLNRVETQIADVPADNVEPGTWNFGTRSFQPLASWTDPAVTAVRVTARYTGAYTFGRVFGATTSGLRAVAVAAVGYVGKTECLKPWAVSYQTLLDVLYPPAGTKSPSYNLTQADIQQLTQMGAANQIPLLYDPTNPLTPGNIAQVVVYDGNANNNSYKAAISQCFSKALGPGDWLNTDPGGGSGQTANAVKKFCDDNGGTQVLPGPQHFACIAQPKVKLIMWDINNGASGANLTYRVKYIGVFAVTGFNGGQGSTGTGYQITGYFTSMASDGSFSSTPSPLTGPVAIVE